MSAFICNNTTISLLAMYACNQRLHVVKDMSEQKLGQLLLNENLASFNYRYKGVEQVSERSFKLMSGALKFLGDSLQVLVSAHCYQYQSCEHPGWEVSKAREIVKAVIDKAIHNLPGYDQKHWELPESASDGVVTRIM